MKAMILAAGRGKRMGRLTDSTPKPLLMVGGKALIVHQIERLCAAGFTDIVINLGYFGSQIAETLGTGRDFGVEIAYSIEPETGLETGGGVFQALPLLGEAPFLLVSADVYSHFPLRNLDEKTLARQDDVHLVLTDAPLFPANFGLAGSRVIAKPSYTFAGISVVHPRLFTQASSGFYPIAPLFKAAINAGRASGALYTGIWHNVGNPLQLTALDAALKNDVGQACD